MGHLIHGDFTQLFGQHDIVYLWLTWVTCLIIPLKRHVHQLPKIKKFFFKTVNQLAGAGAPFFSRSSGQAWFVREDTTVLAVLPCIVALPCEHVPF